jgi:AmmeMemoRadiSam system protein B
MWYRALFNISCIILAVFPARADSLTFKNSVMFQNYVESLYTNKTLFEQAINHTIHVDRPYEYISGITVPHHLLVGHLIASAFEIVRTGDYEKVILLSPDHFKRSRKPFATTTKSFETVFGTVRTRPQDIDVLLKNTALVEASDLFAKEHGIAAILPFVRHYLPDVEIVPITVAIGSSKSQLDEMVEILAPLVTKRTLIVQSTDFSHYLPHHQAILHDQQVLNILSAADSDQIVGLVQPRHIDSRGAQYIQMRLQQLVFGVEPDVLFNSNSQDFSDATESSTTSYVVQVYAPRSYVSQPVPNTRRICFAGDFFTGRFVAMLRKRESAFRDLVARMKAILNGCPLIVNLEGILLPQVGSDTPRMILAMPMEQTLGLLKELGVIAVSVANNHSRDKGKRAYRRMQASLARAGIVALEHGKIVDLGPFRIVALNDIYGKLPGGARRVSDEDLSWITRSKARPPLLAFMHWGIEYDRRPGERELALARRLRNAALWAIVGAHPHAATDRPEALAGGESLLVYSLGNFLFDQTAENVSGAILEMRFFEQGTFFSRVIPTPNFYRDALSVRR